MNLNAVKVILFSCLTGHCKNKCRSAINECIPPEILHKYSGIPRSKKAEELS